MGGELEQETAADRERLLVGRLLRRLLVLNTTEAAQEVDTSNNNKHVEWGSTGSTPIER